MKLQNCYKFDKLTSEEKTAFDIWLESSDFKWNPIERCWSGFTDKGLKTHSEHTIIREWKRSFMEIARHFKKIIP